MWKKEASQDQEHKHLLAKNHLFSHPWRWHVGRLPSSPGLQSTCSQFKVLDRSNRLAWTRLSSQALDTRWWKDRQFPWTEIKQVGYFPKIERIKFWAAKNISFLLWGATGCGPCDRHFSYFISFDPHNHLEDEVLLRPCYRWEDWGPDKFDAFFKDNAYFKWWDPDPSGLIFPCYSAGSHVD